MHLRAARLLVCLSLLAGCVQDAPEARLDGPAEPNPGMSASRAPDETYDDAVATHRSALDQGKADGTSIVYDRQRWIGDVDVSDAPVWSAQELAAGFRIARDWRFMYGVQPVNFARRATFLYPDDGCYARAQAMDWALEANGFIRPANVFTFGNLSVATANHPWGSVSWWFHVAPLVVVNGVAYVLDPSLYAARPLTLTEWVSMQGDLDSTGVSVCSGHVYSPNGNCDQAPLAEPGATIVSNEAWFLASEWSRQLELGRDPYAALGDAPPWAFPQ